MTLIPLLCLRWPDTKKCDIASHTAESVFFLLAKQSCASAYKVYLLPKQARVALHSHLIKLRDTPCGLHFIDFEQQLVNELSIQRNKLSETSSLRSNAWTSVHLNRDITHKSRSHN